MFFEIAGEHCHDDAVARTIFVSNLQTFRNYAQRLTISLAPCYASLFTLVNAKRAKVVDRLVLEQTIEGAVQGVNQSPGDLHGEGSALNNLGMMYQRLGDTDRAINFSQQALRIALDLGDRRDTAAALNALASAHSLRDDPGTAIPLYDQALRNAVEIAERREQANALWGLAREKAKLGLKTESVDQANEALALFKAIEHPLAAKVQAFLGLERS